MEFSEGSGVASLDFGGAAPGRVLGSAENAEDVSRSEHCLGQGQAGGSPAGYKALTRYVQIFGSGFSHLLTHLLTLFDNSEHVGRERTGAEAVLPEPGGSVTAAGQGLDRELPLLLSPLAPEPPSLLASKMKRQVLDKVIH